MGKSKMRTFYILIYYTYDSTALIKIKKGERVRDTFFKIKESAVTENVRIVEEKKVEDTLFKKRLEEAKEILI